MQQGIEITKSIEILKKLKNSISNKQPFGLLRFGDGGLKMIHSYITNNKKQMEEISIQEGIPMNSFGEIINYWSVSANICDFIDSAQVYFDGNFWKRTKGRDKKKMSEKTLFKLKNWKYFYNKIDITNTNYCNPEFNFLSCLSENKGVALPDLLKGKKICCITSRFDVNKKLSKFFDMDVIIIAGKFKNQYQYSFSKVIEKIDNSANDYDVWLIAAGELGRVYTGLIKSKGGRALDIGSIIDFWCTKELPSRLVPYISTTFHHPLKLILTKTGKEFAKFI